MRRLIVCLSLLIFAIFLVGQSRAKQQPPTHQKGNEADNLPTAAAPPVQPQPPAPENQNQANENSCGWPIWTDPFYSNWALVLVTFGAVWIAIGTLRDLKEQTSLTGRSADTANETLKIMKDTAERQLRAYIFPEIAQTRCTGEDIYVVHVKIKNSGQTPAHDYVAYIGVGIFTIGQEPDSVALPEGMEFSKGNLSPGGEITLGEHSNLIPPELVNKIVKGDKALFVYGEATYTDVFKRPRFTRFRLMSSGEVFSRGRFATCSEGNESN